MKILDYNRALVKIMHALVGFFLTFILQFFLVVDPIGGVPIFWSITRHNTPQERASMVKKAIIIACVIHLVFVLAGQYLLAYFDIKISAIKIGGGILLFMIGMEMLYGRTTRTEIDEKEEKVAIELDDVTVTPLAIPLLAGPGSITTVLIFTGMNASWIYQAAIVIGIIIILLISYLILHHSDKVSKFLGELGTKVLIRFMGLMLIFLSVQYVINGIKESFLY